MALTRRQIGNIYRPTGPKLIVAGQTFNPALGGTFVIPGSQVPLDVPIEGFRIVVKLRDVIAVANMTTPAPLGYLNLLKRILISGRNTRARGNATLWDIDGALLAMFQSCYLLKPFLYNGVSAVGAASAGSEAVPAGTPLAGFFNGTIGAYDIRIAIDLPSYPFGCATYARPGYYIRNQEWGDTLQFRVDFGQQVSGASGALGLDAAGTTHTFSSFGSGVGSPTIDVYVLPALMGLDLDPAMTPGYLSRISTPITALLQAAGGVNTRLITLEKLNTKRLFLLVGTSTINPHMLTVSDVNLTTLGIIIGQNRVVRENDDIQVYKQEQVRFYGTQPIQGAIEVDFIQSSNPDSDYKGSEASPGSTFELRGTVAGAANALGSLIQEVEPYRPEGVLYAA